MRPLLIFRPDPALRAPSAYPCAAQAALQTHTSDVWVVQHGCAAIVNLSASPENEARAVGCGAVDAVVCGMQTHEGEPTVQEEGCSALSNLCLEGAHKRTLADAGAFEAAVAAMQNHPDSPGVQMQAAAMLLNAVSGVPGAVRDQEVYRRAMAAGAAKALEDCSRGRWGDDGAIRRTAHAALSQLARPVGGR